jgi:hypothetical protein
MQSERITSEVKAKKIEGMRKLKAMYDAAKASGNVKTKAITA